MSLEERVARLEAMEEISALQARYAALADAKYRSDHQRVAPVEWARVAAAQAGCFTEDAEWDGGDGFGGVLRGRAALTDWFTRSPWRFALHYYIAPQITLTGTDTATAIWRLWQIAIRETAETPTLLAALTAEEFRRSTEGWQIHRMRFTQIHTTDLSGGLESLLPIEGEDR